jgi:alkylhydroperoxidase family enzyme
MPDNAFDVFMAGHPPVGRLVERANHVLWRESALSPVVKERMRIALAETVGCSYCARSRTDVDGKAVSDEPVSADDDRKAELAAVFATAVADGTADDDLTVRTQDVFSPPEFTDLVFSIGWFIGMQHVGRLMHWDRSCPVAPIRELVETGKAR